jgi:hypothetical protein
MMTFAIMGETAQLGHIITGSATPLAKAVARAQAETKGRLFMRAFIRRFAFCIGAFVGVLRLAAQGETILYR